MHLGKCNLVLKGFLLVKDPIAISFPVIHLRFLYGSWFEIKDIWFKKKHIKYLTTGIIKSFVEKKKYQKKSPGFSQVLSAFVHSHIHSFILLFVHSTHNYWVPWVFKAPDALTHLLALEIQILFCIVLECLEALNYTVELFVTILLLLYCKNYSVFIVLSLCTNFLPSSWRWIKTDAEIRGQDRHLSCHTQGQRECWVRFCWDIFEILSIMHFARSIVSQEWKRNTHRSRFWGRFDLNCSLWSRESRLEELAC